MRASSPLLAASVSALLAAGPAAAADGEITSVLLSSGGLAEIVRTFDAAGPAAIRMTVPAAQVDDVLKSLVVADPGGTVTGVSLVGSDSVSEAFRGLPFGPADLSSTAGVAAAMRGFEAEVDDGEGSLVRGVILGVDRVQRPGGTAVVDVAAVSLLTETGGVRQVLLGPAATVTFSDAAVRERIAEAGRALRGGKDDGAKSVQVDTEGTGERQVSLSYVAAAPVWKVSYRAIAGDDGKARLQGWAILENATGEDWTGVTVTLSSSNPVALRQRLYDKYWRERREAPIALPGGPVNVAVDDGALSRSEYAGGQYDAAPGEGSRAVGNMEALAEAASMPAPAPMLSRAQVPSQPTRLAAQVEGDVGVRFTVPRPVDLPSGHTLSVPIIDADYEAELVSLWQPSGGSRHPVATLFVTNGTEGSLPPGIFTIFDGEGYLGDAQILGIPPGETRFAAFAADPKVSVEAETGDIQRIRRATLVRGVLTVSRQYQRITRYDVEGAKSAARTVMIDHPRQIGWSAESTAKVQSDNGSSMRLETRLGPGTSALVVVTETRQGDEHIRILDQDVGSLVAWSKTDGVDPATAARLAELAERRQAIAEAEAALAKTETTFRRLLDEQGRIRQNLAAVPDTSKLAKTYLGEMERIDGELATLAADRTSAEETVERLREAYETAVTAL